MKPGLDKFGFCRPISSRCRYWPTISRALLVLLATCVFAHAELPYKLPPKAKYTASDQSIAQAQAELTANLAGDASALTNLFTSPVQCGPGLWDILKNSPHFVKPPLAQSTVEVPLANGKVQKLPCALLQNEDEVASFRRALADLIKSRGPMTIREPNQDEFMTFWRVIPFDVIDGPLLVAEGKDVTITFLFHKKTVFWADEVKQMHIKK